MKRKIEYSFYLGIKELVFLLIFLIIVVSSSCIDVDKTITVESVSAIEPSWLKGKEPIVKTVTLEGSIVKLEDEDIDLDALSESLKREFISIVPNEMDSIYLLVVLSRTKDAQYEDYLSVYNVIKSCYSDQWEKESIRRFSTKYSDLEISQKKEIRFDIPLMISEPEPTSF